MFLDRDTGLIRCKGQRTGLSLAMDKVAGQNSNGRLAQAPIRHMLRSTLNTDDGTSLPPNLTCNHH